MTNQTQVKLPPPPNLCRTGTPEWVYNEIMRHIEPDLMLEQLPLLDQRYAAETPIDRLKRMKAYDEAFILYDKIFADVSKLYADEARERRFTVRHQEEKRETTEHAGEVQTIEDIINRHMDA